MTSQNSKRDKRSVVLRTLHYYFQVLKTYWCKSLLAIAFVPINVFCSHFFVPYVAAMFIDRLSSGQIPKEDIFSSLLPYVGIMIAVQIVNFVIFSNLRIYFLWKLEISGMYDLARKCFSVLTAQSMQFHNNRFSGSLVSQTNKFVYSFDQFFDCVNFEILSLFFIYLFTFIILGSKVPLLAIVLGVLVILYVIAAYFFFKKTLRINEIIAKTQNRQSGKLADSISNILSVKSYGREYYESQKFSKASYDVFSISLTSLHAFLKRNGVFNMVIVCINGAILSFVIIGVAELDITLGTSLLIVTYGQQLVSNLWGVNHILRRLNGIFGNAYEMTKILDLPNLVIDAADAKPLVISKTPNQLSGKVEFRNITFKHNGAKKAIFEDFNLVINAGERVGLVGVSGSGKTTLTKLLLRFADVQKGEILIDGQNIAKVMQNSLRENIAYVPQESELFHRTLKQNIAYSRPNAKGQDIIRAAKLANAWDFIETMPKKLDTLTGERGVKLSGGQRQRIIIARAILKNAPILVLDEATSALDSESEKFIQEALKELMKNRTSLVIAHRLSTVAELDRIIVLKAGKIIEVGTHKQLLKQGGEYSALWSRQSGAFLN
jgi:ATP-binding cassette subfamily B protein